MVSTLKVNKIQIPNSDSDVMSLDSTTGNITFHKTVSGTAMEKLADVTISSVAADVSTTGLSTDFDTYFVTFHLLPVAAGPDLYFRIFNGGTEFTTSNAYTYDMRNSNDNSQHRSSGNTYFRANRHAIAEQGEELSGVAGGGGISGELTFLNAQNAEATLKVTGQTNYHMDGGTARVADFYGAGLNANQKSVTMDGIKFYFSSGNIHSGRYRIYGIR